MPLGHRREPFDHVKDFVAGAGFRFGLVYRVDGN
jgi:hypothetical protein